MKKTFLVLLTLFFLSCMNKNEEQKNNHENQVEILLRSPGGCIHQIFLNQKGIGKMFFGNSQADYYKKFSGYDEIIYEKEFSIHSKDLLNKINIYIDSLNSGKKFNSDRKLDGYRSELKINNKNIVDVYGKAPDIFYNFIDLIKNELPEEIDYSCF